MATPEATYQQRRDTFAAEEGRLARISFRYSIVRGVLFLAFVACLGVLLVRAAWLEWRPIVPVASDLGSAEAPRKLHPRPSLSL